MHGNALPQSRQHSMAPSHTTLVFCIHLSFISILFIFTSLSYLFLYQKVYFFTREKSIYFSGDGGTGPSVPTVFYYKKFHASAPCRHGTFSLLLYINFNLQHTLFYNIVVSQYLFNHRALDLLKYRSLELCSEVRDLSQAEICHP